VRARVLTTQGATTQSVRQQDDDVNRVLLLSAQSEIGSLKSLMEDSAAQLAALKSAMAANGVAPAAEGDGGAEPIDTAAGSAAAAAEAAEAQAQSEAEAEAGTRRQLMELREQLAAAEARGQKVRTRSLSLSHLAYLSGSGLTVWIGLETAPAIGHDDSTSVCASGETLKPRGGWLVRRVDDGGGGMRSTTWE
jgi:hypothetical protein